MAENNVSTPISRRDAMKSLGLGTLTMVLAQDQAVGVSSNVPALPKPAAYLSPPLPYAFTALSPFLDEKIVRLHFEKHTAGYYKGLNDTLASLDRARVTGDFSSIRALSRDLAFFGSGAILHTLYWDNLLPGGGARPEGELLEAINLSFGSLDALHKQFVAAANAVEGSGWALLVWEPVGSRLLVLQVQNHQDLTLWGSTPLLVCDVWEHAYYLQYENRRSEYVDAFHKHVNWSRVAERLAAARA